MFNHTFRTLLTATALGLAGAVVLAAPQKSDETSKQTDADPVLEHVDAEIEKARVDKTDPKWRLNLPMPEPPTFEEGKRYLWHLDTTEGPITIELMPDVAPRHVSCTLFLTRLGFYDGLAFHRVIKGFMAQGGCPLGNGRGHPGFQYAGEFSPDVRHDRPGLLSMANAGAGTDGSQFFLTFVPTPHLDDKHTIFGAVTGAESFATLKKLESFGSAQGGTSKPLAIQTATVSVVEQEEEMPLPSAADADDPALMELASWLEKLKIDKSQKNWKTRAPQPPKLTFPKDSTYFWNLATNFGTIKIKLMPEIAPMHVSSTIYLSRIGFYDDLKFHRVIPGFMAQGGDPLGNGRGGPAYKYAGEFDPAVRHTKGGLLSMANAGPGTDGSQFFLTFVPTPHLDGKHTIFGEIVEGLDVLKKIEGQGVDTSGRTKEPVLLLKTSITLE
ncbi:MAG: peptidylprolyl isomerase [Planctomycetota bacterium]